MEEGSSELEDIQQHTHNNYHSHHHHHHHHHHHSQDDTGSVQQPQQQQQPHHQLRQEFNKSFSSEKGDDDDDGDDDDEHIIDGSDDTSSTDLKGKSSPSVKDGENSKSAIPVATTPTPPLPITLPTSMSSSNLRPLASPDQKRPSFTALLKLNSDDYANTAALEGSDNQASNGQKDSSSQKLTSPDLSVGSNFSPARIFSKTERVHNPPFISCESASTDERIFGSPPFEDIVSSGIEIDGERSNRSSGNSNSRNSFVGKGNGSVATGSEVGDEYDVLLYEGKSERSESEYDYDEPTTEKSFKDSSSRSQIKKSLHNSCKGVRNGLCPPSFSWVVGVFLLVSILLPLIVSMVVTTDNSKDLIKNQFIDENAIATELFFSAIEKRVDMAENMVLEMSSLVSNQICDISTPEKTVKMLLTLLINFGRGSTLQLSLSNGTSYLVMDYNGEYSYWLMENNNTDFCQHITDETCSVDKGLGRCMEGYSHEEAEWYKIMNTSMDKDSKWSNLTCAAYVYYAYSVVTHVNNEFYAVITSHYITSAMRSLVQFPVEDDIIFFIVDLKNETLVSSSIPEVDVGYVNETTGEAVLYRVSDVGNEFILDADYHVKQRYGSWANIRSESFFAESAHSVGEEMVISSMRLDRNGLSWGIIAIKTANSNVLDTRTCVAIFFTVIFFISVGLIVSEILLRPIKMLSKDMKLISGLNFQPKIFSNEVVPGYFAKEKSKSASRNANSDDESDDDPCCCMKSDDLRGKWSPFNEVMEMQESFSKFRAGAEALTKYVSPQVILDVIDRITINRKKRIKEGDGDGKRMKGGFVSDVSARPARVAVLYTDLENFTSLSEKIKRSLLIDTLNHWFKEFGEIIQKNEGMIDKFIGDCIMALFGAPKPLADNELAACKSALEFKKAFRKVNALLKAHNHPPIGYRVGIHSGEVLLGHIGYEDHVNYTVCGLNVEIANMMEQMGKVYRLSPLVTGDVVTESVSNEYVCVFLNIEKVESVWVRIYHLVCHVDSASKKVKKIAARFDKILKFIQNNETLSAKKEIESAKKDADFIPYKEALRQLNKSIKKGLNSQAFEKSDHLLYPIINRKK